jgi:hypothetical protein
MKTKSSFVDDAGDEVLRFVSAVRNLSRLAELTDQVVAIAQTGVWRRYRTAVGVDEWCESEFDYFLIACDLRHEDVARITAYTREGAALAPMMDREVNGTRRRTLEEAAAAWHSPVPETLLERAQRLGWTRSGTSTSLRAAPLPRRVRAQQTHGMSMDQHAKRSRAQRIPPARRRVLDQTVRRIQTEFEDETERLYVIDRLRERGKRTNGDGSEQRSDAKKARP